MPAAASKAGHDTAPDDESIMLCDEYHSAELVAVDDSCLPNCSSSSSAEHQQSNCLTLISSGWLSLGYANLAQADTRACSRLGDLIPFAGRCEQLAELRRREETMGGGREGHVWYPLFRYIDII